MKHRTQQRTDAAGRQVCLEPPRVVIKCAAYECASAHSDEGGDAEGESREDEDVAGWCFGGVVHVEVAGYGGPAAALTEGDAKEAEYCCGAIYTLESCCCSRDCRGRSEVGVR